MKYSLLVRQDRDQDTYRILLNSETPRVTVQTNAIHIAISVLLTGNILPASAFPELYTYTTLCNFNDPEELKQNYPELFI